MKTYVVYNDDFGMHKPVYAVCDSLEKAEAIKKELALACVQKYCKDENEEEAKSSYEYYLSLVDIQEVGELNTLGE